MTEQQIESLLRKAPRATPPGELLDQLRADIHVPKPATAPAMPRRTAPWLRRWGPSLGFAGCLLACVIVLAVQTSMISQLRKENESLSTAAQNLEQLRRENAEYQRLLAENQELERLRRDLLELEQLRAEATQLRSQLDEATRLRAENQQLAAAARQTSQPQEEDFFAGAEDAKAKAQSMMCINNMKQIGLAARIWATDNDDVLPPNFLSMSNELSTPKILICPSDTGRTAAPNWASFSAANTSYAYLNPNGSETEPYVILTRCPVHGHVGLCDGSVQQGSGYGNTFTITLQEGRHVFTPLNQPAGADPRELLRQRYGLPPRSMLSTPAPAGPTNYYNELMLRRYGLIPAETNTPPSYE